MLVVVDVVNVQSVSNAFLLFATFLASVIVTFSYFSSEGAVKFFGIPNVKTFATFTHQRHAVVTIDIPVTSFNQAFGFGDGVPTIACAINCYGIVVPVVFASAQFVFACKLAATPRVAKHVIQAVFSLPFGTLEHSSAIVALYGFKRVGLNSTGVAWQKLTFPSALTKLFECTSASTSALNNFVFWLWFRISGYVKVSASNANCRRAASNFFSNLSVWHFTNKLVPFFPIYTRETFSFAHIYIVPQFGAKQSLHRDVREVMLNDVC